MIRFTVEISRHHQGEFHAPRMLPRMSSEDYDMRCPRSAGPQDATRSRSYSLRAQAGTHNLPTLGPQNQAGVRMEGSARLRPVTRQSDDEGSARAQLPSIGPRKPPEPVTKTLRPFRTRRFSHCRISSNIAHGDGESCGGDYGQRIFPCSKICSSSCWSLCVSMDLKSRCAGSIKYSFC